MTPTINSPHFASHPDNSPTRRSGTPRRALLSGGAWAAPAAVLAVAAPAYAASQQDFGFGVMFDGGSNINGALGNSYLNLGVAQNQPAPYVLTEPLTLTFDVVGLNPNAKAERDYSASASLGTFTRGTYNNTTKSTTFTWVLPAGQRVPALSASTGVPDVLFSWRDGASSAGRITNKIVVTSISGGIITQVNSTVSSTAIPTPVDSSIVKDNNTRASSPDGIY